MPDTERATQKCVECGMRYTHLNEEGVCAICEKDWGEDIDGDGAMEGSGDDDYE